MQRASMDDSTTAQERQSMWSMIKQGYEGLVMTVIRPMRAIYSTEELGPARLLLGDTVTQRHDLQLKNPAGYTLECSWWKPKPANKAAKLPCIVVLHGNSSCRLGCLEIVSFAIPAGFSVFALDFSGSGLSQGKYVSLGYHEQTDIATVVKYLRESGETSHICLWGRSMGAVASLLYAQNDLEINAMVLDSPFSSLPQLALELVEDGKVGVPKIAVKLVMRLIRRDIKRRAKFDMFKLKPILKINKCTTPAFFVIGLQDELVGPHHVEALHKHHNGPHELFQFPGGHNSPRPINFFIEALQFLRVMVGLLPLPSDVFNMDATSPTSPKRRSPKPVKVYKNPLKPGVSVEAIHQMSIKELKEAAASVGYGDVSCVEKKDLVDLVLKLHQRHIRSKQQAKQYSEDDISLPETLPQAAVAATVPPPAPSSPTQKTAAARNATAPVERANSNHPASPHSPSKAPRRHSDSNMDLPPTATTSTSPTPDASTTQDNTASKPFPVIKTTSSSILSDIELSRELSHGGVASDSDEHDDGAAKASA
ncbi:hypothetical protein Poli38472_012983 [Pythium oligandrum]|uniref:Serine aminopeptidase S33 domain-containing protein n=1 Tax=Pythium oligandrum TaxID=41045 RepID=A0A8K1CKF4_PYTOL|nr:hypothetical protein Poli38472_012983 [Pythium oligandrum]|eukprot:TMW64361.1 hypothetical protein Poli38472_012983 [Pythium oligandrum]